MYVLAALYAHDVFRYYRRRILIVARALKTKNFSVHYDSSLFNIGTNDIRYKNVMYTIVNVSHSPGLYGKLADFQPFCRSLKVEIHLAMILTTYKNSKTDSLFPSLFFRILDDWEGVGN